jgi:hypothetical protein
MSHYTRLRTKLREARLLAAALEQVGVAPVEVHERPQRLTGWGGARSAEQAEVIIRRPHLGASADVGFARGADGSFELLMDSMDRSRLGGQWLPKVTQAYGYLAALEYAEAHGYDVLADEVEQDGTRRLTLRRPA